MTVDGINIVKKHVKPDQQHPQGAIVEITKPIWVSKVVVVDPTTKKPTRIGFTIDERRQEDPRLQIDGKEIK